MVITQKRSSLQYVVAYLLWVVSTGLGIFALYVIREAALMASFVSTSQLQDRTELFYQNLRTRAASSWSIFVVALLLLIMLVAFENLYRTQATKGRIWQIFSLITGIELAVLAVSHTAMSIMERNFRPSGWASIITPLVEALLAVIFFWLWYRKRNATAS